MSWAARCADRAIAQVAGEHARAWGGASLASRLEAAARAGAGDSIADDVLLATRSRHDPERGRIASEGTGGGGTGVTLGRWR